MVTSWNTGSSIWILETTLFSCEGDLHDLERSLPTSATLIQWLHTLLCHCRVSSPARSQGPLKNLIITEFIWWSFDSQISKSHLHKRKAWGEKLKDNAKSYSSYTSVSLIMISHWLYSSKMPLTCPYLIPLLGGIGWRVNSSETNVNLALIPLLREVGWAHVFSSVFL